MKSLTLKLAKIRPYANNPRDITPAVEAVKESIRRFGYIVPIVVDEDHVIITGHTRYRALTELGWTEALVIVSDMSQARANEFRIIDNRSSEIALWDRDRLVAELRSIREDMGIFFDAKELGILMGQLLDSQNKTVDEDEIERTQKELTSHFEVLAENMKGRTMFVDCQHCGKNFGFDSQIQGFGKEYTGGTNEKISKPVKTKKPKSDPAH